MTAVDSQTQYAAACERAALLDLPGRTHIEITGRDRAKFLHNFCTNDIRNLQAGRGCEAFITNVQGKVLAHVFVFADSEAFWIESVPSSAERIIGHLSRYQISEDVTFTDRTAELATLLLAGPQSAAVLRSIGIEPPAANLSHATGSLGGVPIGVRRNDFLKLPAFSIVAPDAAVATCRDAVLAAGAQAAGAEVLEALRIAAGFPTYGVDLTDANLAQEANRTAEAISFTKGCYLGQEPIARIDAMGHVNQQLRVLKSESGPVPPAGSELFAADAPTKAIGRVTSSVLSPATGLPIALAYLRRGHDAPGTEVAVQIGEQRIPARLEFKL